MVFVYGTVCLDRVRTIAAYPKPGGYAEVLKETVMLGGEAANTANALATWGTSIRLAGNRLGQGPDADLLVAKLREKGLPVERLQPGGQTPICDVYVSLDGDRTMFGMGFAGMASLVESDKLEFPGEGWFTADPNLGAAARAAARTAIRHGLRLYLMDFVQGDDPIAPGSIWHSSTDWVGERGNREGNQSWVSAWVGRYHAHCILSDGPNGIVYGSPEKGVRHFPAFPCESLVDSTGAGDMLRAGVLLHLVRGERIELGLAFGAAAAVLKCGHLGATSFVPGEAEVRALMEAHPEVLNQYLA